MTKFFYLLPLLIFSWGLSTLCAQSCSPDVTPPTAAGCNADIGLNSSLSCPFPIPNFTFLLIVSDNCTPEENLVVTQVPAAGTPINFGPLEFVLTVTDAAGNSTVCTYNIMVNDVSTPTVSCPEEITIDLNDNCEGVMPNMSNFVTVFDNCSSSGEITVVQSISEGTNLDSDGTMVEVYVAQNGSRGPSCFVTINLADQEPPQAIGQAATIYLDNNGVATLTPEDVDGGSTDDCGPVTLSIDKDRFRCDELGSNLVTLTVTNQIGLSSTTFVNVEVKGPDEDCDGVADQCDECPGGDDMVDRDQDGRPDCAHFPGINQLKPEWKCGKHKNKVLICHILPGNPARRKTICVSPESVADHLTHGDYIGGCGNVRCDGNRKLAVHTETRGSDQGLNIYPNPTVGFVRLDLRLLNDRTGEKNIKIFNNLGQIVYQELLPADYLGSDYQLDLTNFESGVYYLRLEVDKEIIAADKISLMK